MILIDTHTHLYLNAFDKDRKKVVSDAIANGIQYMFLPNIDSTSISSMLEMCKGFPDNCFPMMGLHPTSVKQNYKDELVTIETWLKKRKFYAIGEIGIDLYWDKSFLKEQQIVFSYQIDLAIKYNLPIVIHCRESFDEIYNILKDYRNSNLRGVFHCFTGNLEQAQNIIELGFYLGIGGVVTFKNSGLDKVVAQTDLKHILLETDSPFLAPVPFRGKRNESAYIKIIANKIAMVKNISIDEVAENTSKNTFDLFNFII